MSRHDDIARVLRVLAPRIPRADLRAVTDRATHSRGLKTASPEAAAWLSLVSYVRHSYTDYDDLMRDGYERDAARFFVIDEINRILAGWGAVRTVTSQE